MNGIASLEQASNEAWPLPVEMFCDIRPNLERRELVKGLIPSEGKTIIFGFPGSGKSFIALDISLCVATSKSWHGRRVQSGGVVYIGAEGQAGLRSRVEAWRREHEPATDTPFALVPTSVDLLNPGADLESLASILHRLSEKWGGISLLSVDTLAATFGGGDENGSDMASFIANVVRLCEPHSCASIVVHHQPLNSDAKRPRGHGSLWGAADAVLHVIGDDTSPVRRLATVKAKDTEPSPDFKFRLHQTEIGMDADGEPVTSCIVKPSDLDDVVGPGKRRLSPKERIALAQLERLLAESGHPPPDDIPETALNRLWITKVSTMSAWRSAALSAMQSPDTKPDTTRKAFERARDSLQASKFIGIWEDHVWML